MNIYIVNKIGCLSTPLYFVVSNCNKDKIEQDAKKKISIKHLVYNNRFDFR